MIFGPIDVRSPNAPVWTGHPGWRVYAVTHDAAAAAERAAQVAAEHRAPLAPGTWPVDAPGDTHRIAVGPVYVAVRTRHGHENGPPLATYYVLRRRVADDGGQAPGPESQTPPGTSHGTSPAAPTPSPQDARWPFVVVGRRRSRAGSTTLGADVITWRGQLAGQTITFSTQPRKIDAHASFRVPANARRHDRAEHLECVDVLVHHPLAEAERAELAALAQAQDPRPVVVRCAGERRRGVTSSPDRRRADHDPEAPRLPDDAVDA